MLKYESSVLIQFQQPYRPDGDEVMATDSLAVLVRFRGSSFPQMRNCEPMTSVAVSAEYEGDVYVMDLEWQDQIRFFSPPNFRNSNRCHFHCQLMSQKYDIEASKYGIARSKRRKVR